MEERQRGLYKAQLSEVNGNEETRQREYLFIYYKHERGEGEGDMK